MTINQPHPQAESPAATPQSRSKLWLMPRIDLLIVRWAWILLVRVRLLRPRPKPPARKISSSQSGHRTIGMAIITQSAVKAAAGDAGWPPIMNLDEAAKAARLAPQTLKRHVSEGRYKSSVKRGRPLLFWRDSFIAEIMKGTWR